MNTSLAIGYWLSAIRHITPLVAFVLAVSSTFGQSAPLDFSTAGYAARVAQDLGRTA